jgi:hypothetical protein
VPLQKLQFKPGINKEVTRFTGEGGWYEMDKVRFRQGMPESIGGWTQFTTNTFLGVCRSLWNWVTLTSQSLIGLGTNLKFYIVKNSVFYDITPIRTTTTLGTNPFTGNGTTTVKVSATLHGALSGDFATFSGVTGTYASLLNKSFQIAVIDANNYTITTSSAIPAGATGGSSVSAQYQINTGPAYAVPLSGWGAGAWGSGGWGVGVTSNTYVRLWSQQNFGQDLVFGPRSGGLYYWSANGGTGSPGVLLNTLGGSVTFTVASPTVVTLSNPLTAGTAIQFAATGGTLPTGISTGATYYLLNVNGVTANIIDSSGNLVAVTAAGTGSAYISLLVDVPLEQNDIMVSDTSRFILALGCNDYGSTTLNPMLVRWSDQNNAYVWTPDATNQAGSIQLSHGSQIVTSVQTRQEIVVFTDTSVYSLQYLGPPIVWGSQLLGDSVSIASPNAAILASGVIYWMGIDKFYVYDGRVQTLNCDLRRYVFNDFNMSQILQVYAGLNEAFNEVWWLYCSSNALFPDKYVVYNYLEKTWYYGTLNRTSWYYSGLVPNPLATTYDSNTQIGRLIAHESGLNDNTTGTDLPINAYISSSEFDLGDGDHFSFVWRMVPDVTFNNSKPDPSNNPPQVTMTLYPMQYTGSGYGPSGSAPVVSGSIYVIPETFTGQIYTRVRGRQLVFKIGSNQINTSWQLGVPRLDLRADGRR